MTAKKVLEITSTNSLKLTKHKEQDEALIVVYTAYMHLLQTLRIRYFIELARFVAKNSNGHFFLTNSSTFILVGISAIFARSFSDHFIQALPWFNAFYVR